MKTCRCSVKGVVQGVGFRFWTVRTAHALNLTGWVRNRSDGTVELLACGTEDALVALQEKLREGPPYSRVAEVTCTDAPAPDPPCPDFSIQY